MIQIVKTHKDAVTPAREHESDVGYDLTALEVYKKMGHNTWLYETGIKVKPPTGYYIEIVPRSSISKTGYMLANSVGTIDPHYRGTLKIALVKVDPEAGSLELPFCLCQIVMRKAHYGTVQIVDELDETDRGDGGFGSTNAAKDERKDALYSPDNESTPFSQLCNRIVRMERGEDRKNGMSDDICLFLLNSPELCRRDQGLLKAVQLKLVELLPVFEGEQRDNVMKALVDFFGLQASDLV